MKKIDLVGKVFGRLRVVSEGKKSACGRFLRWNCICDCGKKKLVFGSAIKTGNTTSCGCARDEHRGQSQRTHGEGYKSTKEYRAWGKMKERCYRKNCEKYSIYGGRGITVCKRWLDSYESFLADMGRAPSKKHSLDRKNTDGNYEPENCRWATSKQQMNNVRYNRHVVRPDGSTCTMAELSRECGVKYTTILQRHRNGWPYHKMISK